MSITLSLLLSLSLLLVPSVVTNDDIICSPYSTYDETLKVCVCPDEMRRFIHCNEYGYIDAVKDCSCVTYNEDTDEIEVGYCIYGCSRSLNHSYVSRSNDFHFIGTDKYKWNNLLCGPFKRTGTLCGSCMNGSYPPAYSFDVKCIPCINGNNIDILKYLLWAFLPLTVFYIAFFMLQINIITSPLLGFVVYSQMVSQNLLIKALIINHHDKKYIASFIRTAEMFYGIWNLDFFRTFNHGLCLKSNTLTTISLDFIIAMYPLLLLAITYWTILLYDNKFRFLFIILKPFKSIFIFLERNWNMRTSTINSFTTFILLSNLKLLSTCFDILIPVEVYQLTSQNFTIKQSKKVYSDGTLEYFGSDHLPYAIMALLIFGIFNLLPVLIFFLYSFKFFRYFVTKFPTRCILFLSTFVDSFQGCYKDGTQPGGRNYRLVPLLLFMSRWLRFIIYAFILNTSFFPLAATIAVLLSIVIILLDPLQKQFQSISHTWLIFMFCIAIACVCFSGTDNVWVSGQSMPLFYFFHTVCGIVLIFPLMSVVLLLFHFIIWSKLLSGLCIRFKKLIHQQE